MNMLSLQISSEFIQCTLGSECSLTISVTDSNITEIDHIQIIVNFDGVGSNLTQIGAGNWLFQWTPQDRSAVSLV